MDSRQARGATPRGRVPGEQLACVEVPELGGAVIGGGHGKAVVKGVALQDVHLGLVPHQPLHLLP